MKKIIMIVLLLSPVIVPYISHAQGNDTFIFNDAKRQWAFSMIPYVFAGGGPMYTNLDLSGLGTKFNGNYQAGAGAYYFFNR